jgi:hypothetical protein
MPGAYFFHHLNFSIMTVTQPMAQVVGHVCQTMDYSLFKTLKGNRTINQAHLYRLTKSIGEQYLLSPIVVNDRFEIIDGQHRFNAAKANNLPINYIIAPGYGLKEVQVLNTNSSNWRNEDYLKAYCDMGFEPYIKFRSFMKRWPDFKFAAAFAIACQRSSYSVPGSNKALRSETNKKGSIHKNIFSSGELTLADPAIIEKTAKQITDFKPYYADYNRVIFVQAMLGVFSLEQYDHEKMIQKLKLQPNAMVNCVSIKQYRQLLTEIYNYRSRDKVSLEF